jgi:hypothetical protein
MEPAFFGNASSAAIGVEFNIGKASTDYSITSSARASSD